MASPSAIAPLELGVTSWALPVSSIAELDAGLRRLSVSLTQLACGDPLHQAWEEGDAMPPAARAAGFRMASSMCSFPGEQYTDRAAIARTAGFGWPATREERLGLLEWALDRTRALGLDDMTFHAGVFPPADDPDRRPFLATLRRAAALAEERGVRLLLETGQEPADVLADALRELDAPNVRVNFDPANMIGYASGDPVAAYELLADRVTSIHLKDRIAPVDSRTGLGTAALLGEGDVPLRRFLEAVVEAGYRGPLLIELETEPLADRYDHVARSLEAARELLPAA